MKQTKEQLLVEVIKLRNSNAEWVGGDERRRKEFAKAFDWSRQDYYRGFSETIAPSWEQIFVEIGKLINGKEFNCLKQELNDLERELGKLKFKDYEQYCQKRSDRGSGQANE